MNRPGVLFVGNFLSGQTGHRQYCEELTDQLDGRGWQTLRTSSRLGRFDRMIDMLKTAWTARDRYDVAHIDVFSGLAFVWSEMVCAELARLDKPYVLTLHGGNLPAFARKWPKRTRRLFDSAAAVTSPSRYLVEQLEEVAPTTVVIPNAVDIFKYPFRHRTKASPRLIWIRAFHEVYNPILAIDVLSIVRKKHPDATLTMVGADKDGSLVRAHVRARELRLGSSLRIVPGIPKNEVPSYLEAGDIFLNTTNIDNTPVSVLEAMACGLCVVTTNVGGIPYLVTHEENGLLVSPRDPAQMAAAINRVVDDSMLATHLSQTARLLATKCDWAPVLARWELLLREVSHHA